MKYKLVEIGTRKKTKWNTSYGRDRHAKENQMKYKLQSRLVRERKPNEIQVTVEIGTRKENQMKYKLQSRSVRERKPNEIQFTVQIGTRKKTKWNTSYSRDWYAKENQMKYKLQSRLVRERKPNEIQVTVEIGTDSTNDLDL